MSKPLFDNIDHNLAWARENYTQAFHAQDKESMLYWKEAIRLMMESKEVNNESRK